MKEKEIGKVFQERLANYSQEPPQGLWTRIQQDPALVRCNRMRRFKKILTHAIFPAAIVVVVAIAAIGFFYHQSHKADNVRVAKAETKMATSDNLSVAPLVSDSSVPTTGAMPTSMSGPSLEPAIIPTTRDTMSPAVESPLQTTVSESQPFTTVPETRTVAPVEPLPISAALPNLAPSVSMQNLHSISQSASQANPGANSAKSIKSSPLRFSHDTMVCRNSRLILFVENALEVRWSVGTYGSQLEIYPDEPLHLYADIVKPDKTDTTIYVSVDIYDCDVFVPSAFTPNGDGLNDEFLVHAPMDITGFECVVFDRMSRVLFQTKSIYQGWDGTFEGKPLPHGAYFYVITYRDALNEKHVKKGQIVLVR